MKTSEFNNVLNNKYTRAHVLSSLELNNLIKNPGRKKGNMSRKIILNKRTWLSLGIFPLALPQKVTAISGT